MRATIGSMSFFDKDFADAPPTKARIKGLSLYERDELNDKLNSINASMLEMEREHFCAMPWDKPAVKMRLNAMQHEAQAIVKKLGGL